MHELLVWVENSNNSKEDDSPFLNTKQISANYHCKIFQHRLKMKLIIVDLYIMQILQYIHKAAPGTHGFLLR